MGMDSGEAGLGNSSCRVLWSGFVSVLLAGQGSELLVCLLHLQLFLSFIDRKKLVGTSPDFRFPNSSPTRRNKFDSLKGQ